MHFGDAYQVKNNYLEIGLYIHEVYGSCLTQMEITSVLRARLFSPRLLVQLLENPYRILDPVLRLSEIELNTETWYVVALKTDENEELLIADVYEVEEDTTEYYLFLH